MRLFGREAEDGPGAGTRYRLRQRMFTIGDDYWIEDGNGHRAFKVDGKVFRVRRTLELQDADGEELLKVQERKLTVRDTMVIERHGDRVATVRKALVGFRDRYSIDIPDGDDLDAKGNIVDHEYQVRRDGLDIASISKRWFAFRDTYGVQIAPGEDVPLLLAVAVCIDAMSHPDV